LTPEVLDAEIRRMEQAVWEELTTDESLRQAAAVTRWLNLQQKLWNLELTPEDAESNALYADALGWDRVKSILTRL
jgi:hypothetical protein